MRVSVVVINAIFNNISKKTGEPGENIRPAPSH